MGTPELRSHLLAILAADAAGYSRLMSLDDRATVTALDAARAVFGEHITAHGGRVIDMAGDSVLAAFETATGAVTAALAVQQRLAVLVADVPEDRRMLFRIGVHMGDVIVKPDGTVYGDGVNIAARLEGIAEPGGITVSESIRIAVKGKVGAEFDDQGAQKVKNIEDAVHAYGLRAIGVTVPQTTAPAPETSLSVGKTGLAPPDKPSIAVLAFANMSGDPEQEHFTDGITEDIITELARFQSLFVIARNSSFAYKGKAVDIKQVGRELGVRYVIEGSIRRAGGRVRVTAQLIDTLTGSHIWAERYDREVQDIFAVQEEVTECIVAAVASRIDAAESLRARRRQLLEVVGKGDAGPLSIVVLPFANLTGDPQQAYLAEGLTAVVTADLSRIRDAFIVSATTAFAYKDKAITVQQIGRELGVRFALQGAVQRSGDKIRIDAQLADTTTNAQLWSESFDGSQGDLFALQEMVTARIGNSLGREMVIVSARDSKARKSAPIVGDLLLRARAVRLRPMKLEHYKEGEALYRQALLLEPNNAHALAGLAASLSGPAHNGLIADPVVREKYFVEARDLALKAKELDPSQIVAFTTLSDYAETHGDFEGARRASETALSLDPKNPVLYSNLASDHLMAGEAAKAIDLLTEGIRLDPRHVRDGTLRNMGIAQFMSGDDETAIEWLLKALDQNPGLTSTYAFLAMAYAGKGDLARSRTAVVALLRAEPKFSLSSVEVLKFEAFLPGYKKYWETRLLPAWRLAGLPE